MTKLLASKEIIICVEPQKAEGEIETAYEGTKNKPEIGEVYAVGSGELPQPLAVGDRVVFRKYAENRVYVEGRWFNFIDFKDIVAKVQE